jgi:hypothetical protein
VRVSGPAASIAETRERDSTVKKIKLDVEALAVESFSPDGPNPGKGTVIGRGDTEVTYCGPMCQSGYLGCWTYGIEETCYTYIPRNTQCILTLEDSGCEWCDVIAASVEYTVCQYTCIEKSCGPCLPSRFCP